MSFNKESENKEIAYDLRQRYATQIGDIREKILIARNDRNYKNWFNLLDSLFIEISHKLSSEEKKEFDEKIVALNNIIIKHRGEYEGRSSGNNVYINLKDMNIWLMQKMEDKDIFGSKFQDDGL